MNDSGCRKFLWQSAAVLGSWAVPQAFRRLLAAPVRSVVAGGLLPAPDETTGLPVLMLPDGFRYLSFGWTGDAMSDGVVTPGSDDGMGVIAEDDGILTLCRNHTAVQNGPGQHSAPMENGCSSITRRRGLRSPSLAIGSRSES
jgi:uncharacterized protein